MRDNLVMLLQIGLFFAGFGLPHWIGDWWPTQFRDAHAPIDAPKEKQAEAIAKWSAYHTSGQSIGVMLCLALWAFDFWAVPRIFY